MPGVVRMPGVMRVLRVIGEIAIGGAGGWLERRQRGSRRRSNSERPERDGAEPCHHLTT